jgi:hypothetical protein
MIADFAFVGATYVQGIGQVQKRTFHRNSGVYIYNLIEMQIYDTVSLLNAGNLLEIATSNIQNPGTLPPQDRPPKVNWQNVQSYTNGVKLVGDGLFESVSACVTGIPYLAQSWHTKTLADLQSVQNRFGLNFTFSLNTGKTVATIVSAGETFSNLAYGTGSKYNILLAENTNWKLYLQSHWGSGVKFQNVTLQKLQ